MLSQHPQKITPVSGDGPKKHAALASSSSSSKTSSSTPDANQLWLPAHDEPSLNKDFLNNSFKISTPDMFTPTEDKMMTHSLNSYVTELQSNFERFSGIKLSTGKTSTVVISLYAPTHGKYDEYLECLSLLTEFLLANSSPTDSCIIGADTNLLNQISSQKKKSMVCFL